MVGLAWLAIATFVLLPLATNGSSAPRLLPFLVGVVELALTVLLVVAIPESRVLLQQPCLLVPPSCALGVETLVTTSLGFVDGAATDASSREIPVLTATTLSGCVSFVCTLLIWSLHAAWLTPMIVRVVRGERAADVLLPTLRAAPSLLGRAFAMLAYGWMPLVLLVLPMFGALPLGPLAPLVILVALILIPIGTPLWNLFTATLLVRALDPRRENWRGVRLVLTSAWQGRRAWLGVLFAQLGLQGLVVILPWQIKVHGFWVGGYDASYHWYSVASASCGEWHPLAAALGFAGVALAIAIKLRIARHVDGARVHAVGLTDPDAGAGRR